MSFRTLLYAYILGGVTFIPLVLAALIAYVVYTSVPVTDTDTLKRDNYKDETTQSGIDESLRRRPVPSETNDAPRTRKGWLTMRRTFEQPPNDTGYVNLVRSFLDARSKDPKRSRPKDMWYAVLKGKVLYLYEDEDMSECEAAIELSGHDVIIYPEGLLDGELFARRNAICLKPKLPLQDKYMPSVTREMKLDKGESETKLEQAGVGQRKMERELLDAEKKRDAARDEALNVSTPWFMFVRSNIEMEDWYHALIHASEHPAQTPTLEPLEAVFEPVDMDYLVATLDEQPDVIPMRWFNALLGRVFFSYYRTHNLEEYIIGRLMKKLSKVKRSSFLSDIVVTEVSVGNKAPTFSKPMLKELTKEGDASMEVHLLYKGEVRITVEATATINLSARLKTYTVKLVLAAILREIEGNLLIKVKRPPSNRIWYAFTQTPRIVLDVEPVVSDRQITWGMILSTIESRMKEIIQESVVMPNMDDIAFFESSLYKRRGGIWPDAGRREKKAVSDVSKEPGQTQTLTGDISVNPDVQDITAVTSLDDAAVPVPIQPVEELRNQDRSVSSSPANPSNINSSDANEESFASLSQGVGVARRRTWFSTTKSDDMPISHSSEAEEDRTIDEDERGRPAEYVSRSAPASARSSRSRDGKTGVERDDFDQEDEDHHAFLSPSRMRRSSSRYSLNKSHSNCDSTESVKNGGTDRLESVTPRRVSDAASTISSSSQPTSSSFLSTLRSKDKQAIKDSAKETMRKWGVNWGLRKDPNTAQATKDPALVDSSASSLGTKMRANYADVRAAVAERREKEKTAHSDPAEADDAVLSADISDQSAGGGINEAVPLSLDPPDVPQKQTPSKNRMANDLDDPSMEGPEYTPILVQPQATTMTIPRIHASHRGEIMSMGYVVPPTMSTDSKNKNPAIQTVYRRLWKSPVLTGQEISQLPTDGQSQHTETSSTTEDVTPLMLSSNVQASPQTSRPVPPPLPPRSIPTAASQPSTCTPAMASASVSTSASEALKSIATKDGETHLWIPQGRAKASPHADGSVDSHESVTSEEGNKFATASSDPLKSTGLTTAPPLPPRRAQTSV
ncbi:hypothetical protein AX17_000177 [Amanita inopinata Kibby_2008]|nr:hypothetical protein AX17_000177 [Amanita inopinata Kibby_2008]